MRLILAIWCLVTCVMPGCVPSLELRDPLVLAEHGTWDAALARATGRDPDVTSELRRRYHNADGEGERREVRNELAFLCMGMTLEYHERYLSALYGWEGTTSSFFDVATVGTATAATFVGGALGKSVFAGTSAVLGATKSPIVTNAARHNISLAVMSIIQGSRRAAEAGLRGKLRLTTDAYSLAEAEFDLQNYFYSASAIRALDALGRLGTAEPTGGVLPIPVPAPPAAVGPQDGG